MFTVQGEQLYHSNQDLKRLCTIDFSRNYPKFLFFVSQKKIIVTINVYNHTSLIDYVFLEKNEMKDIVRRYRKRKII